MWNRIKQLNQNPVYLREVILAGRNKKGNKVSVRFTDWILYFFIITGPVSAAFIYSLCDNGINGPLMSLPEDLHGVFAFSLLVQGLFFALRGFDSTSLFTREKENKTYESLVSTALKPEEIVMGKFWFTFSPLAKLLTVFQPLVFIIGIMIKVKLFPVLLCYLFSLVLMALSCILGLYNSATSATFKEASKRNTFVFLFLTVLIFLSFCTVSLFSGNGASLKPYSPSGNLLFGIMMTLNPLINLFELFFTICNNDNIYSLFFPSVYKFFTLHLIMALVFYILLIRILFRKTTQRIAEIPGEINKVKPVENAAQKPVELKEKTDWFSGIERLLLPGLREKLSKNPVYIKDTIILYRRYWKSVAKNKSVKWLRFVSYLFIAAYVMLFIFQFVYYDDQADNTIIRLLLIFGMFGFSVDILSLSQVIKIEKMNGCYTNLLSSILKPEDILEGKLWIFLYPAVRSNLKYLPFLLILGLILGFKLPGLLSLFVIIMAFLYLAALWEFHQGLTDDKKQKNADDIFLSMSPFIALAILPVSTLAVHFSLKLLNLLPKTPNDFIPRIYPVFQLWFQQANSIGDHFDLKLWITTLIFLSLFFRMYIKLFKYLYRQTIKELTRIPEE